MSLLPSFCTLDHTHTPKPHFILPAPHPSPPLEGHPRESQQRASPQESPTLGGAGSRLEGMEAPLGLEGSQSEELWGPGGACHGTRSGVPTAGGRRAAVSPPSCVRFPLPWGCTGWFWCPCGDSLQGRERRGARPCPPASPAEDGLPGAGAEAAGLWAGGGRCSHPVSQPLGPKAEQWLKKVIF